MRITLGDSSTRRTVTEDGRDTEISSKGRPDPCVDIRAVGEAMMALVLADHLLRHKVLCGIS